MPTPKHHRLGLKQQLLVPVLEARKAKIKAPAHPVPRGGGGAETATSPPQPHMLLFLCGHQCHRGARPSFSDPDYLAKAHPQVVLGPPSRSGGQRGCPNVKCVS